MTKYSIDDLSRLIDHTNLHANATKTDIEKLCKEAIEYHFKMVAINQVQTKLCASYLKGTDINIGAAISFPLGQTTIEAKVSETTDAINNGASEIDYVVNLTEVKEGNYAYIKQEMEEIVAVCRKNKVISKVIFENVYLSKDEIIELAKIAKEVKPDFIKTSTGFASAGATLEDVKLMKQYVGENVKVKAAGGIRDADTLIAMIKSGAGRIGTSSGILIIQDIKERLKRDNVGFIEI